MATFKKKRIVLIALVFSFAQLFGLDYYVSPDGNNLQSGTLESPFRTLEKARDTIRLLKMTQEMPVEGINVFLKGGSYNRSSSFELTTEDSGSENSVIKYTAYNGEIPVITGSQTLTSSDFSIVTDSTILNRLPADMSGKVYQIDLEQQGITNLSPLKQVGFGWNKQPLPAILEVDEKIMSISRYPNNGFMTISNVQTNTSIPRNDDPEPWHGGTFSYSDNRADRWVNAEDPWVYGYWRWDWADGNLEVSSINSATNQITTSDASWYGLLAGQRFYAYNLLEEIDMPGEYYINRLTNMLYVYPPEGIDLLQSTVKLAMLEEPIINITNASNITFEGISFNLTTGRGVQLTDCSNVLVKGSEFKRIGLTAVAIGDEETAFDSTRLMDSEAGGGRNNGVKDCLIYDTFEKGISIMGGDRTTLEPGNNYAINNQIFDYAKFYRTYNAAITLNGVGNKAINNLIYDGPHQAIQFAGNDHLIEKNRIYNVCYETSDSGAIYAVRDWTYRGNVIKYNYISDMPNGEVYAIYLDDMTSSAKIFGNIIESIGHSSGANLFGGGRSSSFENNILINNPVAGRWDNRGMGWASAVTLAPDGTCYQALNYVPYQNSYWAKYSNMANIWEDNAAQPKYHIIRNNVLFNSGAFAIDSTTRSTAIDIRNNNSYSTDPGFVDAANKNWNLKNDSIIFTQTPEFQAIPFDEIGLTHPTPFQPPAPPALPINVTEGFENGFMNWTAMDGKGSPTSSTVQSHTGTSSYIINQDMDVIETKIFPGQYTVTAWIYDTGDTSATAIVRADDGNWRALGINTTASTSKYIGRVDGTWKTSSVNRTNGWHELKWDYSSGTDVKMYIDGNLEFTETGVNTMNYIAIGDYWSTNGDVSNIYFDNILLTPAIVEPQLPYGNNGNPWDLADGAIIELENYDTGGTGKGFYDTSSGNITGNYRDDDVDIVTATDPGTGFAIGYTISGEWLNYTVNSIPGNYDITLRVSSGMANSSDVGDLKIYVDNVEIGTFNIETTGGWQAWTDVTLNNIPIAGGNNSDLKLVVTGNGSFNMNYIKFDASTSNPNNIFYEDFESGTTAWDSTKGTATSSSLQKKSGNYSYLASEDMDVITKTFNSSYNKIATVWYYDGGVDTTVQSLARVDNGIWHAIGLHSGVSSTKYVMRLDGSWIATGVDRTAGWHELKWDYTSGTDVKMYIDNTLIHISSLITSFNSIALGDYWGNGQSGTVYFDDILVE